MQFTAPKRTRRRQDSLAWRCELAVTGVSRVNNLPRVVTRPSSATGNQTSRSQVRRSGVTMATRGPGQISQVESSPLSRPTVLPLHPSPFPFLLPIPTPSFPFPLQRSGGLVERYSSPSGSGRRSPNAFLCNSQPKFCKSVKSFTHVHKTRGGNKMVRSSSCSYVTELVHWVVFTCFILKQILIACECI